MPATIHKQARTTPVIRAELQASGEPSTVLARRYNLTVATVRKWRARPDTQDRSHRPQTLHTTLSAEQELVVVELRKLLLNRPGFRRGSPS